MGRGSQDEKDDFGRNIWEAYDLIRAAETGRYRTSGNGQGETEPVRRGKSGYAGNLPERDRRTKKIKEQSSVKERR